MFVFQLVSCTYLYGLLVVVLRNLHVDKEDHLKWMELDLFYPQNLNPPVYLQFPPIRKVLITLKR